MTCFFPPIRLSELTWENNDLVQKLLFFLLSFSAAYERSLSYFIVIYILHPFLPSTLAHPSPLPSQFLTIAIFSMQ